MNSPVMRIFKMTYRLLFKDKYFEAYIETDDAADVIGRFYESNITYMHPIDIISIEEVKPSEVDRSKQYITYDIYYKQKNKIRKMIENEGE